MEGGEKGWWYLTYTEVACFSSRGKLQTALLVTIDELTGLGVMVGGSYFGVWVIVQTVCPSRTVTWKSIRKLKTSPHVKELTTFRALSSKFCSVNFLLSVNPAYAIKVEKLAKNTNIRAVKLHFTHNTRKFNTPTEMVYSRHTTLNVCELLN